MTATEPPPDHTKDPAPNGSARDFLAARFEAARPMLHAVAYRMLGAAGEADDAVHDAWLRLSRADARGDAERIGNLDGWLTTVVARVCLDVLRARAARRETPIDDPPGAPAAGPRGAATAHHQSDVDVEYEAQVADAVGLALLVVLDRLAPAERVAFVLHDAFDLPFEAIAPIVGRTPAAARQLASRARRRVRGTPLRQAAELRARAADGSARARDLAAQRAVVEAYVAAGRAGDFAALVAVLDPDVVLRADPTPGAAPVELRGAHAVAGAARRYAERSRFTRPALVDGAVGLVFAPRGRLAAALAMTVADGRIAAIDVVTDPRRLARLDLAVLDPR